MHEKEIKLLFDAGVLKAVTILKQPLSSGWYLQFNQKGGDTFVMAAQRTPTRVFKTLDAAFRTVHDIGFEQATVIRNH
jgi:hypothetical protein